MGSNDDFASLMKGAAAGPEGRTRRRFRSGESVEGTVVQIGKESIFVDVGSTRDARLDRAELADRQGKLDLRVGQKLRASVARDDDVEGLVLVLSVGRTRGGVDLSILESAFQSKLPVSGKVARVVKGGVEVDVSGIRAFCPASQVDKSYISDLTTFEGQTLDFLISELKEDKQSVILSRRALLEEEAARTAASVLERISVGGDYEGTVSALQKYGAFVDLGGGVEGLVHISEFGHSRVDRVEDVLSVGDTVTVRVLAMEPQDKSPIPKLRLSMRALAPPPELPAVAPDEVLDGTVTKTGSFGVRVETGKGAGLVPLRELGMPRGADHRKAFPVGKAVKVVLVHRDASGRSTFSFSRVAGVEEEANYRAYSRGVKGSEASTAVGSFGELLRQKLGLPAPAPTAVESPKSEASEQSAPQEAEPSAAPESGTVGTPSAAPVPDSPTSDPRPLPDGVFKRKR